MLWMEPREVARFELADLLAGGTGVASRLQWFAHAPQLDAAVEVEPEDVLLLGSVGPVDWIPSRPLRERHGAARVRKLLRAGLLVGRGKAWAAQRAADERFRQQHWHGLSAVQHMASRWQGLDSVASSIEEGVETATGLRARFGPPPPTFHPRRAAAAAIPLPRAASDDCDRLLARRATCRNFDTAMPLPLAAFAQLLDRVFGSRGQVRAADDFDVLKKTSPSGGALHPTEAYLVVQRVEGVAPGLYHYHPGEHALRRMPWEGTPADLGAFARQAVVGQHWFADAHVLVVLASRFARNFWKYRNHAKAYRVCVLDAGHLSQTLFVAAAAQGLGAFVTAAINEVDIERAFGLEGYVEGPLAVCGFGIRAATVATPELEVPPDPAAGA